MAQRKRPTTQSAITLTHPNAAGIDIGSVAHFVAVPPDRDDEPMREFASFTADLHRLADWLDACGVDTVAMESTSVELTPRSWRIALPPIRRCFAAGTLPARLSVGPAAS